jgi:hypothetical protein
LIAISSFSRAIIAYCQLIPLIIDFLMLPLLPSITFSSDASFVEPMPADIDCRSCQLSLRHYAMMTLIIFSLISLLPLLSYFALRFSFRFSPLPMLMLFFFRPLLISLRCQPMPFSPFFITLLHIFSPFH